MDGNMTVALSDLQHAPSADNRLLYNAAMKKVRDAAENVAKYSDFVQFVGGGNKTVKLENELLTLDLSSKGGQIAKATLKKYMEKMETACFSTASTTLTASPSTPTHTVSTPRSSTSLRCRKTTLRC